MTTENETIAMLRLNLVKFLENKNLALRDLQVIEEELMNNPFSRDLIDINSYATVSYIVLKPGMSLDTFLTKTIIANKKTMTQINVIDEAFARATLPLVHETLDNKMDLFWVNCINNAKEEYILTIIPRKIPLKQRYKHYFGKRKG